MDVAHLHTGQLLLFYSLGVVLAALVGGLLPIVIRFTHRQMEMAVSFVAGIMMGVALLHLLPEAIARSHSIELCMQVMLVGLLTMFFLERFFCFHHHDAPRDGAPRDGAPNDGGEIAEHICEHAHHNHSHGHDLRWSGAAVGLSVHSIVAGLALGASVQAGEGSLAGFATFLAIAMHKPFDALTISALMKKGGRSSASCFLVIALFALAVPLGAFAFHWGAGATGSLGDDSFILGMTLAFSAGIFLCVALSDLLPELQFHQHDRALLSIAMLLGVAVAWVIEHQHEHGAPHSSHASEPLEHSLPSASTAEPAAASTAANLP